MNSPRSGIRLWTPHVTLATLGAVLLLLLAGCGDDIVISKPLGAAGGAGAAGIFLFKSPSTTTGNIGGRAGADGFVGSGPPVCLGKTVQAFISVGVGDTISDMPANYGVPTNLPIRGALGPLVANNWADLLDGSISADMAAATGGTGSYWTGSTASGTDSGATCTGWTLSSGSGTIGDSNLANGGWLSVLSFNCANALKILGVCY